MSAENDDDWSPALFNESAKQHVRDEYRLLRDLMTNYDPAALPTSNVSDVQVHVKMGIALFQIRELVGSANY